MKSIKPELNSNKIESDTLTLDVSEVGVLLADDISSNQAYDLKVLVQKATDGWIQEFFDIDGVKLLIAAIDRVNATVGKDLEKLKAQFHLLKALKTVVQRREGIDDFVAQPELVASIALNLDSEDAAICQQTLEILAAIMLMGQSNGNDGSRIVMEAMDFLKMASQERVRFHSLVDALASKEISLILKRDILFFLNTAIQTAAGLEERLEIRADLVYAGMLPVLDELRKLCDDELSLTEEVAESITDALQELKNQIEVFDLLLQNDSAECVTDLQISIGDSDLDLSDPEQIFKALWASSVEYECFMPFLSVLQGLLAIPSYDSLGKQQWDEIEQALLKILTKKASQKALDSRVKSKSITITRTKRMLAWKERVQTLARQNDSLRQQLKKFEESEVALTRELNEYRDRELGLMDAKKKKEAPSVVQQSDVKELPNFRRDEKRRKEGKPPLGDKSDKNSTSSSSGGLRPKSEAYGLLGKDVPDEPEESEELQKLRQELDDMKAFADELKSLREQVKQLEKEKEEEKAKTKAALEAKAKAPDAPPPVPSNSDGKANAKAALGAMFAKRGGGDEGGSAGGGEGDGKANAKAALGAMFAKRGGGDEGGSAGGGEGDGKANAKAALGAMFAKRGGGDEGGSAGGGEGDGKANAKAALGAMFAKRGGGGDGGGEAESKPNPAAALGAMVAKRGGGDSAPKTDAASSTTTAPTKANVTGKKIPFPPALPGDAKTLLASYLAKIGSKSGPSIPFAPPLPAGVGTTSKGDSKPSQAKEAPAKPKKPVKQPKVPMRALFWSKIPDKLIDKTVWAKLNDENIKLDLEALEKTFCKAIMKASSADDEKKEANPKTDKPKEVTLLDPKVQQNVGIALAKYKMPSKEIKAAIIRMDESRLDLEKLNSLRSLAPSPDDISTLKEYDGDNEVLGRVEQFFLQIIEIPRYNLRLDCFIFKLRFPVLVSEIKDQMSIIAKGTDTARELSSLKRVLEIVLAMGNYLNGGTPRGGIYGFKLDGLLKLATVKSVDNKINLMHFLASHCETAEPTLLRVNEELGVMEEASRVSIESVRGDLSNLKKNVELVTQQIQLSEADKEKDKDDKFVESLSPFRDFATKEVGKLDQEFTMICLKFGETVESYGEDLTKMTTEEFFGMLRDFAQSFDKAKVDNEKRKAMQEKADKKKAAEDRARLTREAKLKGSTENPENPDESNDTDLLLDGVIDVVGTQRFKRAEEIVGQLKGSGLGVSRNRARLSTRRGVDAGWTLLQKLNADGMASGGNIATESNILLGLNAFNDDVDEDLHAALNKLRQGLSGVLDKYNTPGGANNRKSIALNNRQSGLFKRMSMGVNRPAAELLEEPKTPTGGSSKADAKSTAGFGKGVPAVNQRKGSGEGSVPALNGLGLTGRSNSGVIEDNSAGSSAFDDSSKTASQSGKSQGSSKFSMLRATFTPKTETPPPPVVSAKQGSVSTASVTSSLSSSSSTRSLRASRGKAANDSGGDDDDDVLNFINKRKEQK